MSYDVDYIFSESKRCLNCKKPLCRTGCPIDTPIPQMIQMLLHDQMDEAGEMLFQNNPLSVICGLVCDHEKQCEGHCILNRKNAPIAIGKIEHYISNPYLDKVPLPGPPDKNCKAAIIGAGPAGITIALILRQRGYDVTIFETREKVGGVLRYGIPEYRLPKSILDRYEEKMVAMGIQVRPNTAIGQELGVDDLFRDGYRAIFIGTGVWKPKTLRLKGESLGNVHYAINYLVNPDSYQLGERVAVIGAGNSAMDAARTAVHHGAKEVTVYLRSDRVAASAVEAKEAEEDGVRFVTCRSPVEFTAEGPILRTTTVDENHRTTEVEGSDALYPADSTIIAIGQGPRNLIVSTTHGIDVDDRGLVITDEGGRTTRAGVFASGDVVSGAKTVVEAANYSKKVADAMDAYMSALCEAEDKQG